MIVYLAGGVSGNLSAAWRICKEPAPDGFMEALKDAGFWRGGSRGIG